MERGKNNKTKKSAIGIVVIVIVILLLIFLLVWNTSKNDNRVSKTTHEIKQLELFTAAVKEEMSAVDATGMSYDELQSCYTSIITNNQKKYGGTNAIGVDAFALDLTNIVNSEKTSTIIDLTSSLTSMLDGLDVSGLLSRLLGDSSENITKTLTMKSGTVCATVVDQKYCVDNLSANVYITNPNSDKWAVLLHGVSMSGSLIYSSLGSMYEAQGYNIIAPDLRGFGNSGGSVAMGYLESLDVYDWLKDLNTNYDSRYGVNVAPNTIVVHGVSLGGATTLQLATNPDIAKATGTGPYTKNLTQLNVKGFVDDCGYTSMSGIITGMLSGGDTSSLISLLDSLNISEIDFMTELQNVLGDYNISGFEEFGQGSYQDISGFMNRFGSLYETINSKTSSGNNTSNSSSNTYDNLEIPGYSGIDWDSITEKYEDYFNYDGNNFSYSGSGDYSNIIDGVSSLLPTNSNNNASVTLINNTTNTSGNFLDGLIGTVLMKLVGVGLTEDNYDIYSNVFSAGRTFPSGSKVVIVHGTSDTTVPHSNADTVAVNVSPATLVHKWDAEGMPHAFIVVGSEKETYTNLIKNFTNCVNNSSCTNINR